jgi:hypothetical protein
LTAGGIHGIAAAVLVFVGLFAGLGLIYLALRAR